ncbi:DUF421 domain-containing protein [Neobacillus notoginsengisoli]|uniref:DUF421 domain-containing protein n=1 Tax=Neobacillus notoginsengisoli TaxID=1578198 RepID=A0A417YRF8_9BACI|nr:YetF domain-containing protein [Neobacillus notoginsengisoli]RHW37984.1 DUF421 domain-containing protein [Neobacillus notoginsengisoli]
MENYGSLSCETDRKIFCGLFSFSSSNIKKVKFTIDDLKYQLREHGVFHIQEVEYAFSGRIPGSGLY